MATLTVRNLSEQTRRALKERAARNDLSMEAEARAILDEAVAERTFVVDWIYATEPLRGEDLPLPERSPVREVEV